MSARDNILARVRKSLAASDDVDRLTAVSERLAKSPRGIIPARGQLDPARKVQLFCDMATTAAASVHRVDSAADVPKAVTDYLRSRNLPARVRMGGDRRLKQMPWVRQRALQVRIGPSEGDDEVTVSHAAAGIAETGTLMLHSGKDNPTTLNFLPEHHVVVVDGADIEGDLESAVEMIRRRFGKGEMPRTLNFVTGPSRSGDIEQKLLLGAHGPRALHVIVVGGP